MCVCVCVHVLPVYVLCVYDMCCARVCVCMTCVVIMTVVNKIEILSAVAKVEITATYAILQRVWSSSLCFCGKLALITATNR